MERYTKEMIKSFMEEVGFKDIRVLSKEYLFIVEGTKQKNYNFL